MCRRFKHTGANMFNTYTHTATCMRTKSHPKQAVVNRTINVSLQRLTRWRPEPSKRIKQQSREVKTEVTEEQKNWPANKALPLLSFIPSRFFQQYCYCNIIAPSPTHKHSKGHTVYTHTYMHTHSHTRFKGPKLLHLWPAKKWMGFRDEMKSNRRGRCERCQGEEGESKGRNAWVGKQKMIASLQKEEEKKANIEEESI